jgi:hypothetical protein
VCSKERERLDELRARFLVEFSERGAELGGVILAPIGSSSADFVRPSRQKNAHQACIYDVLILYLKREQNKYARITVDFC